MSTTSKNMILQNVVISFVKIYEAVPKMSGNGKEYSIQVIVSKDHGQLRELQQNIIDVKNEAFPNQTIPKDCLLIRDSDAEGKGDQYEYMRNTFFFNVRRNEKQGPVPCAMPSGKGFVPTQELIFSGCICNVHMNIYDYQVFQPGTNRVMKRGVTAALNGLQLVDNVNVTRLGGTAPAPQFGVIENATVNEVMTSPGMAQDEYLDNVPEAQQPDPIEPAPTNTSATDVPW